MTDVMTSDEARPELVSSCFGFGTLECRPDPASHGRAAAYAAYIASNAWRLNPARLAELAASEGRCRLCDDGPPSARIEVHHRDYARLGCERPSDLTTLCAPCHRCVTSMLRSRRYAARDPIPLADVGSPLARRRLAVSDWLV